MIVRSTLLHIGSARSRYSFKSWLAATLRTLRAMVYFRKHQELLQIGLIKKYVQQATHNNLFYHVSHRFYLANFLSLRERIDCALFHARFEDWRFDETYKKALYLEGGLPLWEKEVDGVHFSIILKMASRIAQEGDLEVSLLVDKKCVHRFKFTWLDGARVNQPATTLPWITCCQGRDRNRVEPLEQFSVAFPNNWPKLFCYAALRGVALAIGSKALIGLPGHAQTILDEKLASQFSSTYDEFWKSLDGRQTSRYGYLLPAQLTLKPLDQVSSKHRKRAEGRRFMWSEIEQAACSAIGARLLRDGQP